MAIRIPLYKPHPGQLRVLREQKRYNVLSCGRRWGKTLFGEDRIIEAALAGKLTAWLAPTYRILAPVWRDIVKRLKPIIRVIDKTEKYIELVTGGVIEFWSLDNPDAPRGRKYHLIIIDEAALIRDPEAWPAVLQPMLIDYGGSAWFLSTPRGRNWFWQNWILGQDPLQVEWASWQMPTVTNTKIPNIAHEVESARLLLPTRLFEQEYLAKFLEDGTGVFRNLDAVCILDPQTAPIPGHTYVMGVDWGKSNDFTVISVYDSTLKQQALIDRFNQIGWTFQTDRLVSLAQVWKPRKIRAEENSMGGPLIEALQRNYKVDYVSYEDEEYLGQPLEERAQVTSKRLPIDGFHTTAESKGPLIESFALALERGQVQLLNDPVQKAELTAYELSRLPSGRFQYSAPDGMHDDTVIAGAIGHDLIRLRSVVTGAVNPFYG